MRARLTLARAVDDPALAQRLWRPRGSLGPGIVVLGIGLDKKLPLPFAGFVVDLGMDRRRPVRGWRRGGHSTRRCLRFPPTFHADRSTHARDARRRTMAVSLWTSMCTPSTGRTMRRIRCRRPARCTECCLGLAHAPNLAVTSTSSSQPDFTHYVDRPQRGVDWALRPSASATGPTNREPNFPRLTPEAADAPCLVAFVCRRGEEFHAAVRAATVCRIRGPCADSAMAKAQDSRRRTTATTATISRQRAAQYPPTRHGHAPSADRPRKVRASTTVLTRKESMRMTEDRYRHQVVNRIPVYWTYTIRADSLHPTEQPPSSIRASARAQPSTRW